MKTIKEKIEELQKQLDKLKEEIKMPIRIHKEPIVGELAIFWHDDKDCSNISIFQGIKRSTGHYIDSLGFKWKNAILFESAEQYKNFIKEPND